MCSPSLCESALAEATIQNLEMGFGEIAHKSARIAAEVAYAIAYHYQSLGDMVKARDWARTSLSYFGMCDTDSYAKCLPVHPIIAGIQLPDLIHEGVVRHRFSL